MSLHLKYTVSTTFVSEILYSFYFTVIVNNETNAQFPTPYFTAIIGKRID